MSIEELEAVGLVEPCGYCGTANDPEVMCKNCWDNMQRNGTLILDER